MAEWTRLFYDIIKFTHSHEVVVTSSERNVWNCQGICDRDASIACNAKQRTVLLSVMSFIHRAQQNHMFGLGSMVMSQTIWLVNRKDGSGLQPTPKINNEDNGMRLWLLNLWFNGRQILVQKYLNDLLWWVTEQDNHVKILNCVNPFFY